MKNNPEVLVKNAKTPWWHTRPPPQNRNDQKLELFKGLAEFSTVRESGNSFPTHINEQLWWALTIRWSIFKEIILMKQASIRQVDQIHWMFPLPDDLAYFFNF